MDDLTTTNDNSRPAVTETAAGGIYVIAAHPAWRESRVNRLMMEAARSLPGVEVRDLYSTYPDYDIHVAREQAAVERARLIVLLHPIQWYSMPPLQKLWLDEVLTYGWAYGSKDSALRGKDFWLVATTGAPAGSYAAQSYNRYPFEAFLPPYDQTAALCGMRFLPPLILHGSRTCSQQEVTDHIEAFRTRLHHYPGWPDMRDLAQRPAGLAPSQAQAAHDGPLHQAAADTEGHN